MSEPLIIDAAAVASLIGVPLSSVRRGFASWESTRTVGTGRSAQVVPFESAPSRKTEAA